MTSCLSAGSWLRTASKPAAKKEAVDGLEAVFYEASSNIYKPPKGVFSGGPRACPGRRFAQTKIIVMLAVVFGAYSAELDVSVWASDEEVAGMAVEQKRAVYGKAIDRARRLIRGSEQTLTLKIEREPCGL